jgi:membrane protease YdiL (CAAX protease family)
MGDLVNSQASLDPPPPGSAGMPVRPPRRSAFREVPWRWSDLLLGFAPKLLLSAATFLIDPRAPLAAVLRQLGMPLLLLSDAWMLGLPLWIARTRGAHPPRLPRPRAVLVEALFALLSLPVVFAAWAAVSAIAANLLAGVESPTFPWASRAVAFNRAEWLTFIAMAVTLGPVAEETFYRGFLYNALRQRLHPIPAALIQAVVFGCVHPFGLANSVGIGVAAVALAVVYEWRKTLLTPILVHAATNAVGMVLLSGVLAAEADAPRIGVLGEARQGGCLVTEVVPGGAAETAGIRVGDLITTVDGEPVADVPNIARLVRAHQVGDTVSVEFLREGTAHRADVVLARLRE